MRHMSRKRNTVQHKQMSTRKFSKNRNPESQNSVQIQSSSQHQTTFILESKKTEQENNQERNHGKKEKSNINKIGNGKSNQQPNKNNENRMTTEIHSSNPNEIGDENEDECEMTFQDLKATFLALEFTGLTGIVPAEMDRKSGLGKIDPDEKVTRRPKFLYGLWQKFVRVRLIILILVGIHTILNFNDAESIVQILRNFLTMFVTFVSVAMYFAYFESTAYNMNTLVIIFNGLTESVKSSSGQNQNRNRMESQNVSWNKKLWIQMKKLIKSVIKRPLSVTLFIYLPFVIYIMICVPLGTMLLDPNSPILLSSYALSLSPAFGFAVLRIVLYIVLAILDVLYYFFFMSEIYIAVFTMLFFIIQIQKEIDKTIQKLRFPDGLEQATRSLWVIKLLILLFNLTLSTIVYLTKLITLAGVIIGGFLMIKLFNSHPIFTLPFGLMFVEGNVVYTVLFDKVYQITEKVEQLKEEILIKAQNTNFWDVGKKEEYKKICRSVQSLGVECGGFYLMERETSLIFGDFAVQQIVDLLLTFS